MESPLLIVAVVVIAGAIAYLLIPGKTQRPLIERVPPGERDRYITLEKLLEDHLDLEDEKAELRKVQAARNARKARARAAAVKLVGEGEPAPN
jgi:hypothetical protein